MKNAKKLMLLLLSLVLLVGAFAVAAFAEDAADAATVVYPDGTVETYAVGETIVPKEFTDGLYYGPDRGVLLSGSQYPSGYDAYEPASAGSGGGRHRL